MAPERTLGGEAGSGRGTAPPHPAPPPTRAPRAQPQRQVAGTTGHMGGSLKGKPGAGCSTADQRAHVEDLSRRQAPRERWLAALVQVHHPCLAHVCGCCMGRQGPAPGAGRQPRWGSQVGRGRGGFSFRGGSEQGRTPRPHSHSLSLPSSSPTSKGTHSEPGVPPRGAAQVQFQSESSPHDARRGPRRGFLFPGGPASDPGAWRALGSLSCRHCPCGVPVLSLLPNRATFPPGDARAH